MIHRPHSLTIRRATCKIMQKMNDNKMECLQDLIDVCLLRGADGADIEWGNCATSISHEVIHWSFSNNDSHAPSHQLIRLNDEQLNLGNEALNNAARALGKNLPRRPAVTRLLLRNYYQVAWSQSCYTVTTIKGDSVPGGTARATTMSQLHPGNHNLYVFDQDRDGWFQFVRRAWVQIDSLPRLTGVYAGIASQDLKPNGRDAIRKLIGSLISTCPQSPLQCEKNPGMIGELAD
ncbi:hypothetical protein BDW59DRAFT_154904 [Aspergillus cavernicola]|uniref:Uncharacterized protein n=1 Tax=Aspergillus cavernicola TaxID=176166 RepID=A0ABR4HEN3_9EURO